MSKVRLSGATVEDFDNYFKIRCESSDIYWMGHTSAPNYDMLYSVFLERLGSRSFSEIGDQIIFMAMNENGETIGFSMISLTEYGIEIGISLFEKYQGQGLGTQIISEVISIVRKYNRTIYARIRDDNYASQSIFQKNGFERTDQYEMRDYPKAGYVAFRKYIYRIANSL